MVFSLSGSAYPNTINTATGKHEEPDWYPANRAAPPRQARRNDTRDFSGVPRGVFDERDTRMQPISNDKESLSYAVAIKTVNDALSASGDPNGNANSIVALRGLWRVFDAAIGELGAELNDSLSNKAIFEGEFRFYSYAICTSSATYAGNKQS
jgi:hypothetical protein